MIQNTTSNIYILKKLLKSSSKHDFGILEQNYDFQKLCFKTQFIQTLNIFKIYPFFCYFFKKLSQFYKFAPLTMCTKI